MVHVSLWPNDSPVWIYHGLFIRSLVDGHLDIMGNVAVDIHVRVFGYTCVFIFLGYLSRSGIARSRSNSV